jgi:hypothetical protein
MDKLQGVNKLDKWYFYNIFLKGYSVFSVWC